MDEFTEKYKGYSTEELENILKHVDKEKYPDRYESARIELIKKLNERETKQEDNIDELASLSDRLAAAIVDAFIIALSIIIIYLAFGFHRIIEFAKHNRLMYFLISLIIGQLLYLAFNGRLLYKYGQTIGKRYLDIKIVDMKNNLPELSVSYGLRYFIPALFPLFPLIGGFISLLDILFIFKKDRRCIHDHIAGTKVIKINYDGNEV